MRFSTVQRACLGWLLLIALPLMTGFEAHSQEEDGSAPSQIDLSNFPGQLVDDIVVPIPAEIFTVLDKLDEPNWESGIDIPEEMIQTRERAVLALTFGSLVGEGFIAVQAKSAEDIQQIGRLVLAAAEPLGLSSAVKPHSLSIIEAAEQRDWDRVREELDSTQQTVRSTMEQLRDDELSELVSLGGWLRGTNVVTEIIAGSFSEDKAELLNQPVLLAHFRNLLGAMEGPSRRSELILAIAVGLEQLEAIIVSEGIVTEGDVNELFRITREMLKLYYFVEPEAAPVSETD